MAETSRKPFQGRSFTSLVLTLSFLWMTISGLVLYLAPPGGVARRSGWTYWQLGRDDWMAQHVTSCLVFLIASLAHIWLNRRPLWNYIHSRARRGLNRRWEMLAAMVLTAFMVAGTIWHVPPWSWAVTGSQHIRAYRQEEKAEQGHHHEVGEQGEKTHGEGRGKDGKGRGGLGLGRGKKWNQ